MPLPRSSRCWRAWSRNGGQARFACRHRTRPSGRSLPPGWRAEEHDLFMATDPALLDPRRAVPSPALA